MAESTQHKLDRIRPPRVQITYDVEIGGAIERKELPFIVGIMADLAGQQENPLPPVKERRFVEIDRDNFNDIVDSVSPRLALRVPNELSTDGGMMNVVLNFKHLDDFQPVNVVKQVEPLRKLFEVRQRLSDLLAKLDGNDDLDRMLQEVLANTQKLDELKEIAAPDDGAAKSAESAVSSEEPE